jgi:hypothetical protein
LAAGQLEHVGKVKTFSSRVSAKPSMVLYYRSSILKIVLILCLIPCLNAVKIQDFGARTMYADFVVELETVDISKIEIAGISLGACWVITGAYHFKRKKTLPNLKDRKTLSLTNSPKSIKVILQRKIT